MPRRPTPLSPDGGPHARFALALRALRDSAGFDAPTIDNIAAKAGIPRSTLFAAMRGTRIPTVPVLAALVRAWNGNEKEWLKLRSQTEQELEQLRRRRSDAEIVPEHTRQEARLLAPETEASEAESLLRRLARAGTRDVDLFDADDDLLKDPHGLLLELTDPRLMGDKLNRDRWARLRFRAGYPTIRTVAQATGLSYSAVRDVLQGYGEKDVRSKVAKSLIDAATTVGRFS